MHYLAAWKVLEEMIVDFRKRGMPIPANIISDLRHARTLINVLRADASRIDIGQKVEKHLRSVEAYLISQGQERFGAVYVEKWLKQLDEANKEVLEEEEERKTRFVSGLPKRRKWIRIKPSAELPVEKLEALAEESNLSCNVQDDDCLLVYGSEESVKAFVKKMTAEYGLKAGRHRQKFPM